jgi:hypothetical protein
MLEHIKFVIQIMYIQAVLASGLEILGRLEPKQSPARVESYLVYIIDRN